MARSILINRQDMVDFLTERGFQEIKLPGTKELVMGRIVQPGLCLRVYTSVVGEQSRDNGEDAIRTVLVAKVEGDVKIIGSDRRVHRVEGWKDNLNRLIEGWRDMLGAPCPVCGAPTVRKKGRRYDFWGCSRFPICRGSIPNKREPRAEHRRQPVAAFSVPDDIFDSD